MRPSGNIRKYLQALVIYRHKCFSGKNTRTPNIPHFEQALAALAQLPERRDTVEQAIDLRCDLRNALVPLSDYARMLDYLRAAEALAERLGDAQRLGRISCHLCSSLSVLGEHDRAMAAWPRGPG